MTRINLVPPAELCDQHLLAEHREIVRVPNHVARSGKLLNLADRSPTYTLGTGHVRFFYDKLAFLHDRYYAVWAECRRRGFQVQDSWPRGVIAPELDGDYVPTPEALAISRARIAERMPERARFTSHIDREN